MDIINYKKHVIQCPHCGKDALDHMETCPHCEGALRKAMDPGKLRRFQRAAHIAGFLAAAACLVVLFFNRCAA